MFRAVDRVAGRGITILDLDRPQVEALRPRGHDGDLRCPACDGAVLVKAGHERRWHFAHEELRSCPLADEPAERLALRVRLYEWLRGKFPGEVGIEQPVPGVELPRPVDVLVRKEGKPRFAYWVLTGGIRSPDERGAMSFWLSARGIPPHFLFSRKLLRLAKRRRVDLRPTERELMRFGWERLGRRLHYLDAASGRLLTLRGIRSPEGPLRHRWETRHESPLEDVLVSPRTGELVHPAERETYVERQKRRREPKPPPPPPPPPPEPEEPPPPEPEEPPPPPEHEDPPEPRLAPCRRCGRQTPEEDWIVYEGKTGRCVCRRCMNAGPEAGEMR